MTDESLPTKQAVVFLKFKKFKNTTVYFVSNDSSGVKDYWNLTSDESLPTKQAVVFFNFNSDFNATDAALVFIIHHKAL